MAFSKDEQRCFGKPEGIEKRLAMWGRQLSVDKSYPWVGLGLIDDLACACRMLGGDPESDLSRAHARELLESATAPVAAPSSVPTAPQRKKTRS